MKNTAYEKVSSLLPADRKIRVLMNMRKNVPIPGFRPGKAPVNKILNLLPRNQSLQTGFLIEVFHDYFPDLSYKKNETEMLEETESDEAFPGILAAYFLQNKGADQQLPEELQSRAARYKQRYLTQPEASEAGPAQADVSASAPEAPAPDEIPSEDDVDEAAPETEADAAAAEEFAPEQDKGNAAENTETMAEIIPAEEAMENEDEIPDLSDEMPDAEDENDDSPMDYHSEHLGFVLKESTGGNGAFYNFYPAAKIDENGFFIPYPRTDAKSEYPRDGKINLSSGDRNYKKLQSRFQQGGIYILEIEDNYVQANRNPKGDLYWVEKKIDIEDIDEYRFLHKPEEPAYQYYQVCTVQNLPSLLCDGDLILIKGPGAKRPLAESVLLKDEKSGWMVGPFPTIHKLAQRGEKQMSWFADPHTEGPQYIYDVYTIAAGTNPMVYISIDNDLVETDCLVKLPSLKKTRRDFITDELLLKEIHNILQNNDGEKPDFTQSLFCSPELPDEIIAERIRRMEQVFQRDLSQHEIANRFSDTIAKFLLNALKTDMEDEEGEIIQKLAETPKFLDNFAKYRKLQESFEKKHQTLKKELEACQGEINTRKEEIADLEARKEEYLQNIQKLGLADDISALMERKDALNGELQQAVREREQAERERNEIQTQTQQIISGLEETLNNPLKSAVDAVVHRRLYEALYTSMAPSSNSFMTLSASEETPQPQESSSTAEKYAAVQPLDEAQLMAQLTESFHNYRPDSFTDNDIVNLYICLTQGFLTVFAGAPGTGKTSACRILAHSLGLDSDDAPRFILVPVERGWGSKRDFIGYYNPLTKSFDRSNSQVYEALETSDAESERYGREPIPPQIILLDEANLSQMEYYWSVFMNAADYSPKSALVDLGNGKTFRVSKALRFLATINNDNTTEGLSPRLIDRAWIISLPTGREFREVDFTDVLSLVSMQELERYFGRKSGAVTLEDLDPACSSILKAMYSLCQELHWEVSERSKGAILQYCLTGCRRMFPDKTRIGAVIAADYAISQKILPRLQGHGTDYRDKILMRFKTFFHQYQLTKCESTIDRILREGNENMNYYHFFSLGQA